LTRGGEERGEKVGFSEGKKQGRPEDVDKPRQRKGPPCRRMGEGKKGDPLYTKKKAFNLLGGKINKKI